MNKTNLEQSKKLVEEYEVQKMFSQFNPFIKQVKKEIEVLKEKIEKESNLYFTDGGKRRENNKEALKLLNEVLEN